MIVAVLDVTIDTSDGPMPAAVAEPTGAPRGGIVVIQEAFGLTAHIVEMTRRLAESGWLAVAPALFHRQGAPVFDYDGGFEELRPVFESLDAAGITTDVEAALRHAAGHPVDISVNVSARQLEAERLVDDVRRALRSSGLPATALIVEITETTIMRDTDVTVQRLDALKAIGVRLAIDDFGTGYSSLAYLRQFPVDSLKIDRSFITAIADSSEAAALIHTLVHLGKALGLATLAEGIEDDEQYEQLRGEECDRGQGYLFARPLTAEDLTALLDDNLEKVSPD